MVLKFLFLNIFNLSLFLYFFSLILIALKFKNIYFLTNLGKPINAEEGKGGICVACGSVTISKQKI
jgi:hypothetical protein